MSENDDPAAAASAPNATDGTTGPTAEGAESTQESKVSAARSDPLADARASADAIAVGHAYQSFQRSVSAAGSVGVIGSTTVSGGMHFYSSAPAQATQTAGPVRSDLLDEIRSWYAEAPHDREVRSTLSERRLVAVHGIRGSGRSTTALKLLAEFAPGKVRRLAIDAALSDVIGAQIEPNHGYLGEYRPTDPPVTEEELDRLALRLVEQDAYCVLVLAPDDSGTAAGIYAREHLAPPQSSVLERRLEAASLAVEAREGLTALGEDPELRSLIGTDSSPSDEVWLAELVIRIADGEIERAEALQTGVELVDRQIGEWLTDLPQGVDLHRHRSAVGLFGFRLALAVLNDSPADLIVDAGERLAWELYTTANPRLTPGRNAFIRVDEHWLARSRAQLRQGTVNVGEAAVPARLLTYRDERLPVRLLAEVWNTRPNLRRPILRWLQDLSQDRRPDVWMRASLAIGLVTSWDFAYSYHEAIEAWTESDNVKQRFVAATALDQAARAASTRAAVGSLLKDWARGDNAAQMWTAAAVFSYGDGASDVSTLLQLLRRIGVWETGRLAIFASACVGDLFTHGAFDEVLAAVDAWIGDDRTDEHVLGLLTVLRLSDLRVRHIPNLGELPLGLEARSALEDASRAGWPLVVALAQYSGALGKQLVECVWQTLSSTIAGEAMRDVIGDWIRAAASSPGLLIPLGGFLRGLIDDEDDKARLLHLVDMLATDPYEPIPYSTAFAVRAAIEHGQAHYNQLDPAGR